MNKIEKNNDDIILLRDMLKNINASDILRISIEGGNVGWNHYLPKKMIRKYLRMELRRLEWLSVKLKICSMLGCFKREESV